MPPRNLVRAFVILWWTLGIAILFHAGAHPFRWDLLIDAAGVLFVAVHGPLTREQWALALGRAD